MVFKRPLVRIQSLGPQTRQNPRILTGFLSFIFIILPDSLFLPFSSDLNRDPYKISERSGLETTGEQVPHVLHCLPLGDCGHVGVSVQSEPRAEAPQHPGSHFPIRPILEGYSREHVSEVMEPDPGQPRPWGWGNTQGLFLIFLLRTSRTPIVSSASGRMR